MKTVWVWPRSQGHGWQPWRWSDSESTSRRRPRLSPSRLSAANAAPFTVKAAWHQVRDFNSVSHSLVDDCILRSRSVEGRSLQKKINKENKIRKKQQLSPTTKMETNSSSLGTDVADANETSLIQEDLQEFKYYSEGVVLTPISVFGVIGKYKHWYVWTPTIGVSETSRLSFNRFSVFVFFSTHSLRSIPLFFQDLE